MGDDTSNSQQKTWFNVRLRELRVAANLKQRQVAAHLGLASSSYANAESSPLKKLSLDRVHKLAALYRLGPSDTQALVDAWNGLPQSEYSKREGAEFARRREQRQKAKAHDEMRLSLLEVTSRLIEVAPDPATLCTCSDPPDMFEGSTAPDLCELCDALRLLGLPRFTDRDDALSRLAVVQEKMST